MDMIHCNVQKNDAAYFTAAGPVLLGKHLLSVSSMKSACSMQEKENLMMNSQKKMKLECNEDNTHEGEVNARLLTHEMEY